MFKNYKNTIFEKNILPIIPPKAELSPLSKIVSDQLGKIPGRRNDQGLWTGFPDWTNHQTRQLELDQWSGWNANVGIRAGEEFFFVDVDIEDPAIVTQLHEFAVNMLGAAPVRGRSDSNRVTMLFMQADHIGKQALKFVNTETGEVVGLDIIGSGGHSAVHGDHTKGGKYLWDINPYEYGALTQVSSSRVEAFLRASISYLETQGYKLTSGGSSASGGIKGDVQERHEGSFNVELLQGILPRDLYSLIKDGPSGDMDRSTALAKVMNRLISLDMDDNKIADILLDPTNAISAKPIEKGVDWVMADIARFRAKGKSQSADGNSSSAGSEETVETDLLRDVQNLTIDSDRDTIAVIIDKIIEIKDIIFKEQLLQQVAVNTGLGKRNVNRIVKQRKADSGSSDEADEDVVKSHRQITDEFRMKLLNESIHVVCSQGLTYFYDPETSMWEAKDMTALVSLVSREIIAQPNFMRGGDYNTVAKLLSGDVVDEQFFTNKRHGFVGDDGLYYEPGKEPRALQMDDRATSCMNAHPEGDRLPSEFLAFLERAFEGQHKETQLKLVQEVFGAVLCGMMPSMQVATMILGPGRTGKSTLIEILQAFFPRHVITSIAPYDWTNEYYLAAMSQSWINFISDLDSERKINGGVFKQVMDRSPLTARFPAGVPFQFVNHAAQVFIGNETPFTNDQSAAFTRRWVVLEMNNVIAEADVDYHFADRLIQEELGAIMMWAMKGAERVIENNGFTHCPLSDALKTKWMSDSNSALMFVNDDEVFNFNPLLKTQFGDMFTLYKAWCKQSGYRPFGKKKFYEILRSTGRIYMRDRVEFFIGTGVNPSVFSSLGLYATEMYGDTAWDALKGTGPLKDKK